MTIIIFFGQSITYPVF